MFASFRRHQRWIWIIGVIVVIPSFVVFFTPWDQASGSRVSTPQGNFGTIGGVPVSREEFLAAQQEMRISYLLRSGKPPANDEATQRALERDTFSRAYILRKIKEMDIRPSEQAVGRLMQERIGNYPYAQLEKDHLAPAGVTLADWERYIRNEAGIQQLVGAAAVSARLVDPKEAESLYRKENQEVSVEVVPFFGTNYLSQVVITNGAVSNFFGIRAGMYRIPERIQVSYVEFPATNYFAEADKQMAASTNLAGVIDQIYFQRGTNSFTNAAGAVLTEAEAKARIKDEARHDFALLEARRAAAEFGNMLIKDPQPNRLQNLEEAAAKKGFPIKLSPPIDRSKPLEGTEFPEKFRETAVNLTEARPVAFSPIPGTNAVYVIALKNRLLSESPPFESVQDKVEKDYREVEARQLARNAGQSFHTNLTNGLSLKKSFDSILSEAKLTPIKLPPFAPSTQTLTNLDPRLNLRAIQSIIADLEPGQASRYIPTSVDGGIVAYLREKIPLTDEKVKAGLPEFISNLRAYRQTEAFNNWFRRQVDKDRVVPPARDGG